MKTKMLNLWESLRTSFWFIPALMIFAATVISFGMIYLDIYLNSDSMTFLGFFYLVSPDGARLILSTIAGSMMTVAGVTFSITIVVLNLASSQFGPRLLRNFMQDRSIQAVLGTFVASFVYCLLVLRSIQTVGTDSFVPSFAVALAIILAFFAVGVLIYFIHHVAISIQADKVVATVGSELESTIRRMFTYGLDEKADLISEPVAELQQESRAHQHQHHIIAPRSGYLQAIDLDGLFRIAADNRYLIHAQQRPGQYIVGGSIIAIVGSEAELAEDLRKSIAEAFIIGQQRTAEQDVEFSIHQLVEIAVRALSPGINDPHTAIACIDQLGTSLCFLAKMKFPSPYFFDEQGRLCLLTNPLTYSGIVNAAFDNIRQYGRTSVAVNLRLLEMLSIICRQSCRNEQRMALRRQAEMILRACREVLLEQNDMEDIYQRYQILITAMEEKCLTP